MKSEHETIQEDKASHVFKRKLAEEMIENVKEDTNVQNTCYCHQDLLDDIFQ